jgi:hypothetical protein
MTGTPEYRTGEAIRKGDRVRLAEWDGIVEFIITKQSPGWDDYWSELGEGVMLQGPKFGSLYTHFNDEDLEFVGRGTTEANANTPDSPDGNWFA